ncbi:transglutaminase domain-containing protein [Winogradskyella sp.]
MKRFLLAFSLLLLVYTINAQDYKRVDSIVDNYPKRFKSIKSFSDRISFDFKTDLHKTRAAYYWVSNNISYDFESFYSVRNSGYSYETEAELLQIQMKYAEDVLKNKSAVCEGYSQLLKFTLRNLNINCEVIDGYAKTEIKEIGRVNHQDNHAWNAVYLDNKWQLMDATWSTGNEYGNPGHFELDDAYFLTNPEDMIWSHFPSDKKWQLIDEPVSKLAFFYAPIIHHGYYDSGLVLSEMKGNKKSEKFIEISFENIDEAKTYDYIFPEKSNFIEPIQFERKGKFFIAKIPYSSANGRELIIFDDRKACLSFKIR